METRSDDHDSILNASCQGCGGSMEDVHCHRPTVEFLNGNIGFVREADVL